MRKPKIPSFDENKWYIYSTKDKLSRNFKILNMDRLMRKEFAELLEISEPMKIVDNLSIGMISKKKKKSNTPSW
jgi:hypothetical protein